MFYFSETVQFIDIDGKPLTYSARGLTKLSFEDNIENASKLLHRMHSYCLFYICLFNFFQH